MNIPSELFTAFNDITYYDEPHKYFIDGKELISVTTLIHKYQEDFDEEYWSNYKANQYNLTANQVKRAWNFINKKGTTKGSIIHNYAENLFQNKKFEYPLQTILNEFGFDPVFPEYEITKKHVDKFYSAAHGKLIPIRTEMVVCDQELMIGGMLDILFYNVKMGEFQIWDYKTNKEFTKECKERHLLGNLCTIEDCDLEVYSLQLEMYKQIIEKFIPIKLGTSHIVWFSHNNPTYKIIETKNRKFHVDLIFAERLEQLAA